MFKEMHLDILHLLLRHGSLANQIVLHKTSAHVAAADAKGDALVQGAHERVSGTELRDKHGHILLDCKNMRSSCFGGTADVSFRQAFFM